MLVDTFDPLLVVVLCVVEKQPNHRYRKWGKLPAERITTIYPDNVFATVGVNYAGPVEIKCGGPIHKPTILKAYIYVFISMSVKAVEIEVVSDLRAETFLNCLQWFMARRGKPNVVWSNHGTNFTGVAQELKELTEFLQERENHNTIADFCSSHAVEWRFIPERTLHFGDLWEAAVKNLKTHLRKIIEKTKLTFEELITILAQIEACLNSRL